MSILQNRDFVKILAGTVFSTFGSSITLLVLPVIAVSMLDASASELGFLAALASAPYLLLGPFVGVVSDRIKRRRILISSDVLRAIVILSIMSVFVMGELTIEVLYVAVFLIGVGDVWFDVAHHAYLPTIVEKDQLVSAHGKFEMGFAASKVSGPSVAGIIMQTIGAPVVLLIDCLTYVISAFLIFRIKKQEDNPRLENENVVEKGHLWREIAEGYKFLSDQHVLFRLMLRLVVWMFVTGGVFALMVMYLIKHLDFSMMLVGVLFSIMSIGFFLGSALTPYFSKRLGMGQSIMLSNLLAPLALILLSLVESNSVLSIITVVIAFVLYGVTFICYRINNVALRQALTPNHLIGRVSSLIRTVSVAANGLGALVIGTLSDVYSIKAVFFTFGCLSLVIAFVGLFSRNLRSLREVSTA